MYKVCAIGDADSVFGFASVGLDVLSAEDDARALHLLRDACKEGYAVILITERLASSIPTCCRRSSRSPASRAASAWASRACPGSWSRPWAPTS